MELQDVEARCILVEHINVGGGLALTTVIRTASPFRTSKAILLPMPDS